MATLSLGGRISVEAVPEQALVEFLGPDRVAQMDLFDRAQLNQVLEVCKRSRSLSEAGRTLFSASIGRKTSTARPAPARPAPMMPTV
jgi:transcriptional regulatory protein RtcR